MQFSAAIKTDETDFDELEIKKEFLETGYRGYVYDWQQTTFKNSRYDRL